MFKINNDTFRNNQSESYIKDVKTVTHKKATSVKIVFS